MLNFSNEELLKVGDIYTLFIRNRPLMIKYATFHGKFDEDILGEFSLTFLESIKRFDPSRNFKFTTLLGRMCINTRCSIIEKYNAQKRKVTFEKYDLLEYEGHNTPEGVDYDLLKNIELTLNKRERKVILITDAYELSTIWSRACSTGRIFNWVCYWSSLHLYSIKNR